MEKIIAISANKVDKMSISVKFLLILSLVLSIMLYINYGKIRTVEVEVKGDTEYVQSFVPVKDKLTVLDFKELNCLALNIYHESRGESAYGRSLVGQVTRNRVNSDKFPNTYCDVVYQKKGKTAQFSWTNDGKSDETSNHEAWSIALKDSYDIINEYDKDLSEGALFYHKNDNKTKFSESHYKNIEATGVIGQHIAYKVKT